MNENNITHPPIYLSIHPSIYPSLKSINQIKSNQIKSNQPGSNPSRSVEKKKELHSRFPIHLVYWNGCLLPAYATESGPVSQPASQSVSLFLYPYYSTRRFACIGSRVKCPSCWVAGLSSRGRRDLQDVVVQCSVVQCIAVWLGSSCRHAGEMCMCMCMC